MDGAPAEPAAAIAAEAPGRPLPSGRSHSTTPIQRLPHNRAAACTGQRVMRHFLRGNAILRRRASLAFTIAPLTLRMLVTAAPAVLVAAAGAAQGPPARRLPAVPGAVDIATIAAAAENDLSTAGDAAEPAGGVIHRGSRPGREGPTPGLGPTGRFEKTHSCRTTARGAEKGLLNTEGQAHLPPGFEGRPSRYPPRRTSPSAALFRTTGRARIRISCKNSAPCARCTDCGGRLKRLGEDVTGELEYIPGRFVVKRMVRPHLACSNCEKFHLAPLPPRPIERGRPGPGLLAHVLVSKYCDHLPPPDLDGAVTPHAYVALSRPGRSTTGFAVRSGSGRESQAGLERCGRPNLCSVNRRRLFLFAKDAGERVIRRNLQRPGSKAERQRP